MSNGFRGHRPSCKVSWPMIVVAGAEKTGKSYTVAELTGSDLIGETFWIEFGENTAEEYGGVPGARYIIAEHDGSFNDVCRRAREAVAEPPRDGKPNLIVIDSVSLIWETLSAEAQEIANRRKKADVDAESKITSDIWNVVTKRWNKLLQILRTHRGPVILVARLDVVAVMDAAGQPTKEKTRKVKAQKNLPYDADVIVQIPEYRRFQITGVRSLSFSIPPGETFDAPPDFTLDSLLRRMGLAELGVADARSYVEPAPSAQDAMDEAGITANSRPAQRERGRSDDEWSNANPAMATPQQVDYLNEGLKVVRGAETVEARLTALSQILDRKLPEGYRLTRSDVETATAALAEEDRQNAKLRAQDAAKAERAAKAEAKPEPATGAQLTLLNTLTSKQGITDRNVRLAFLAGFVKRPLTSSKDLTKAEASAIIDRLNAEEPTPDALSVREVLARRIRTSPTSSELADASEAVWKAAEAGDITQEQASGLIDLSMARENTLAQPVGASA